MHVLNVILKRIKVGSRDVIMEEKYMEEKYETENDELVYKAQSLTGSSTKIKRLAFEKCWGLGLYISITLWTKFYHAHHIYIQPNTQYTREHNQTK